MFSHFNSPLAQWQVLPSFLIGEYLFILGAVLALIHAWRSGRDHLLIWIAALACLWFGLDTNTTLTAAHTAAAGLFGLPAGH